MSKSIDYQTALFPDLIAEFPSTRYQGSKAKLVGWIWDQISALDFDTCLDAFGGTGVVSYLLKSKDKQVTYNDILRFNYHFGLALIENSSHRLESPEIDWLLQRHSSIQYPTFVQNTFHDIYFTDEENAWIDQTITNIRQLTNRFKYALAFYALCQACIIKRPYNLFHRKNLYMRTADVHRSFGNKTTWDRPFEEWFRIFVREANRAVIDNGRRNAAMNLDALNIPGKYDLVYVDTPYISKQGIAVDYFDFYHFLEGLTMYDEWRLHLDHRSKHRRLLPQTNAWMDAQRIRGAFDLLFQKFQDSILVVSYRSDGIPAELELVNLLKQYKRNVSLRHYGQYKYVLSTNSESREIILIGT